MIFKEFKILDPPTGGRVQKHKGHGIYGYSDAYIGISQCFAYRSNEKTARKRNFGVMSPPTIRHCGYSIHRVLKIQQMNIQQIFEFMLTLSL